MLWNVLLIFFVVLFVLWELRWELWSTGTFDIFLGGEYCWQL